MVQRNQSLAINGFFPKRTINHLDMHVHKEKELKHTKSEANNVKVNEFFVRFFGLLQVNVIKYMHKSHNYDRNYYNKVDSTHIIQV
jgi:hypothetical protein